MNILNAYSVVILKCLYIVSKEPTLGLYAENFYNIFIMYLSDFRLTDL